MPNNLFVLILWTHTQSGHDGKDGGWAYAQQCRLLTKTDRVITVAESLICHWQIPAQAHR